MTPLTVGTYLYACEWRVWQILECLRIKHPQLSKLQIQIYSRVLSAMTESALVSSTDWMVNEICGSSDIDRASVSIPWCQMGCLLSQKIFDVRVQLSSNSDPFLSNFCRHASPVKTPAAVSIQKRFRSCLFWSSRNGKRPWQATSWKRIEIDRC